LEQFFSLAQVMGNIFRKLFPEKEDPVAEKKKLRDFMLLAAPGVATCPADAIDPMIDFHYTTMKARVLKVGETCPSGTSDFQHQGDMMICAAGISDAATKALRDAAMAKLKACVEKNVSATTSTFAPEPMSGPQPYDRWAM
jgi:hypothetical protein